MLGDKSDPQWSKYKKFILKHLCPRKSDCHSFSILEASGNLRFLVEETSYLYMVYFFPFFKVTDFLFFIGKLVITACMVGGSWYLFIRSSDASLHYNGATPLIAIAIGSYIIASMFFGVYQMAVDTLFLCFCTYLVTHFKMYS